MENVTVKRNDIWMIQTNTGIKPHLIVSNDVGNEFSPVLLAVLLKKGVAQEPTHMQIGKYVAMFEQMTTYSKQRLDVKIGENDVDFTPFAHDAMSPYYQGVKRMRAVSPIQTINWGDFYFLDFTKTKGCEQGGTRLVMVCSNAEQNKKGKVLVIPATSRKKRGIPTHVNIPSEIGIREDSVLLVEQMREVSVNEFFGRPRITVLPKYYYNSTVLATKIAVSGDINETIRENQENKVFVESM